MSFRENDLRRESDTKLQRVRDVECFDWTVKGESSEKVLKEKKVNFETHEKFTPKNKFSIF